MTDRCSGESRRKQQAQHQAKQHDEDWTSRMQRKIKHRRHQYECEQPGVFRAMHRAFEFLVSQCHVAGNAQSH